MLLFDLKIHDKNTDVVLTPVENIKVNLENTHLYIKIK